MALFFIYLITALLQGEKLFQFTSSWTSSKIKGKRKKNDFLALRQRFPEINLMAFPSMQWKFARNIALTVMSRQINDISVMSARHVLLKLAF